MSANRACPVLLLAALDRHRDRTGESRRRVALGLRVDPSLLSHVAAGRRTLDADLLGRLVNRLQVPRADIPSLYREAGITLPDELVTG